MATTSLVAKISTKGAKKSAKELELVGKTAKKTEGNVVKLGTSFKSVGKQAGLAAAAVNGPMGA